MAIDFESVIRSLPKDPTRALVYFADETFGKYGFGSFDEEETLFYVSFIYKFSEKYNVTMRLPVEGSVSKKLEIINVEIHKLKAQLNQLDINNRIDDLIQDFDDRQDLTFGLAHLNSEEKEKIHIHIGRIRELIEESDLPDRKKNALYERLNSLAAEVDAHGTRTDRFFAFAGDAAYVLGDMATKAKPFIDEVKEVIKLVSRSRARQEGISLPPGDEPLSLPSPDASTDL